MYVMMVFQMCLNRFIVYDNRMDTTSVMGPNLRAESLGLVDFHDPYMFH